MQNDSARAGRRALRLIPAVSRLLETRPIRALVARHGAGLVRDLLRERLESLRRDLIEGRTSPAELRRAASATRVAGAIERAAHALLAPRPRTVINATGVVVHTNLGRSLLSPAAAARVAEAAGAYVDLEYDLERGRRGSRLGQLEPLMSRLFPGQGFVVVNNNAAAIMLALRALARGKQVPVSRGELVEIGGSFRVPDIMAASGAKLVEVGTTNRTRLADYERALSANSGAILKVHTSNFRIVGFTEETPLSELATLAHRRDVPLVVDWGSGDLVDLGPLGIHDELPVREVLGAGADLVTFSGDKLLGGPQAGFVVGRPELIDRLRRDPLARVCRLDRLLIAALQATLSAYVRGRAFDEVPTLKMLAEPPDAIDRRARRLGRELRKRIGETFTLEIIDGVSRTGGGSSPTGERPTRLLAIAPREGDAGRLEARLRAGEPPVVARVHEGRLLLDLRTVLPSQESALVERVAAAADAAGGTSSRR